MEHYSIYHHTVPSFLQDFAKVSAVQRLKLIGMNCGCEYTAFPLFQHLQPYSRYDHSLGTALIIWHFTESRAQAVSGLLHDLATPVFAHVIDFLNGDYLVQESTEAGTEKMIAGSAELQELLKAYGLKTEDVCDYHRYPIADNDSPRLSADRLEYSLGNMQNCGFCPADTVQALYGDLMVGKNESGEDEIMFRTAGAAETFAAAALKCSRVYVSDEDRYAMQILSEILQSALGRGVIRTDDLYTTEPEVIAKLERDELSAAQWRRFRSMKRMSRSETRPAGETWRQVSAKKRCIDPMVKDQGRVSNLSPAFRDDLNAFLCEGTDLWISGSVS